MFILSLLPRYRLAYRPLCSTTSQPEISLNPILVVDHSGWFYLVSFRVLKVSLTRTNGTKDAAPWSFQSGIFSGGWKSSIANPKLLDASTEICRAVDINKGKTNPSNSFSDFGSEVLRETIILGMAIISNLDDYKARQKQTADEYTREASSKADEAESLLYNTRRRTGIG